MRAAAVIFILVMTAAPVSAQSKHQAADDSKAIQDCIKTAAPSGKPMEAAESCIGTFRGRASMTTKRNRPPT